MKEKKKVLLILGVLIALISVVGVSYAVWQLTKVQTGTNVVTSGCFKVEFTDQNPIQLTNAYPITNEEGKTLTPYEFTITNTCESEASYQINLEILNDSTFIELGYIREMLNEKGSTSGSRILTRNKEVEKTLENASSSYKLNQGVLAGKESKTFEFRLWMDNNTPVIESVMEKTLNSKITVITSYKAPVDTTNMMVAFYDDDGNQINSYSKGDTYKKTLKKIIFEDTINPYENALEVVDFSENKDESVLGYYVANEDNTDVTLYVQANGKIKANMNARRYFSSYVDLGAYRFEGIENIDTSEVRNMSEMFRNQLETNLDLSHFDTSNVTNMSEMFFDCSQLTSLDLSNFDTSNVTTMWRMFDGMSHLTSLDISSFDTSNVTNMGSMFAFSNMTSVDVSHFDTSNVTDMSSMFYNMTNLTSLDLRHFDTSSVTNMSSMFAVCTSLTSLDLSQFDTSNVTDMSWMFYMCSKLFNYNLFNYNLNISSFNTSNVTNMSYMFAMCTGLIYLDVSHFDTSKVTDMSGMFCYCRKLNDLDLSNFDTSNVINMSKMFAVYETGLNRLTNIIYGDKFIHNANVDITDMYQFSSANKPTHESWSSVTW